MKGGSATKFFIEIFSGTGVLSAAVRVDGMTVYEFDIKKHGRDGDVLNKKVNRILVQHITSGDCLGVWFGCQCGTFSSARRHDGGPPPLSLLERLLPQIDMGIAASQRRGKDRVLTANRLLKRMHELCKLCEPYNMPFYIENPLRSKLWRHPLVMKRIRHTKTRLVVFDYCQFGTACRKNCPNLGLWQRKI